MTTADVHQPLCAIAAITTVFGIRGEVKIQSYARSSSDFPPGKKILAGRSERETAELEIEYSTERQGHIFIKFRSIDDRSGAEQLRGQYIFVVFADRKKLPAGSFFIDEIIGMKVQSGEGIIYGTITEVMKSPAHDLYVISTGAGDVLLPAVPTIVRMIDSDARTVIVDAPEGLFTGTAV
jgi:16S rRNA processing protein RimM